MKLPEAHELFDFSHTIARELFDGLEYPFEALPKIKDFIIAISKTLPKDEYTEISEGVFVANDAKISDKATILPPTVIGHKTEVRPGAFIRGSALIGDGAVIGNSTEIKNAIIFDGAQLPHYNYVGDSILGYKAHLGAGAVISNFKLDHSSVNVKMGEEKLNTGLRKFGALMGDFAESGCNSVINPGTIIGRNTIIYPLTSLRGVISENSIVHNDGKIVKKH
ncbi:MAG: UDP-N-acetylglucosamine pyrophosphorylase [Ruminococcaceae bacterium]|nr:UDP-N-acetylglucosamine pyrophosphorylase [Oscillospiraceae bacterium]